MRKKSSSVYFRITFIAHGWTWLFAHRRTFTGTKGVTFSMLGTARGLHCYLRGFARGGALFYARYCRRWSSVLCTYNPCSPSDQDRFSFPRRSFIVCRVLIEHFRSDEMNSFMLLGVEIKCS